LIACSRARAASALMISLFIEPHVGDGQRKYTPIPSTREAAIVCRKAPSLQQT
jgi:hypothetical protein